jgi:acyl CoA:acetate/3-ketoacid CoA transferase beta subunit
MTDGFAAFTPTQLPPGANPYRSDDGVLVVDSVTEYWNPYANMFTILWNGRRHVMMGASQVDQYGNQNIACIGDWHKPKAQLLGFRGAPGNTINHTTSYWIPNHTPKSVVAEVDVVSGVGYDRAAALDPRSSAFHEIRRLVTNLGVFDFETADHRMQVRSVHPGVTLDEIHEATAFELVVSESVDETRLPSAEELTLIRTELDPKGARGFEVKN